MIKAKVIGIRKFNPGVFEDEAYAAAKTVQAGMVKDFETFVSTWEDKPKFKKKISPKSAPIWDVSVTTDDNVFRFVDLGTKKHKIRPKKPGGILAFPSMFKAKTSPKVIQSGPGYHGGETVFAREVNHPGTKARRISREIALKWSPIMAKELEAAIKRGARRSGHGK